MARTAEDYGLYDLDDATLATLAGDVRRYGEKGKFAGRELASRRGLTRQADQYRAALERAAYSDAGRQYGAGLDRVTASLAGMGPLADSGAATALRAKLASQIYGNAQSQIGRGYADYLGQALRARQQFAYQKALANYQKNAQKRGGWASTLAGIGGAAGGFLLGGPMGAAVGYGVGSSVGGGGSQASDAYYG